VLAQTSNPTVSFLHVLYILVSNSCPLKGPAVIFEL